VGKLSNPFAELSCTVICRSIQGFIRSKVGERLDRHSKDVIEMRVVQRNLAKGWQEFCIAGNVNRNHPQHVHASLSNPTPNEN
jgi:hypothetical protein